MSLFGFLNIAKKRGSTSHDVVNRVRKIIRIKRVGHGGTLDPAAEGVLIVAVGNACRLLRFLDDSKIYLAEILLGTVTTTDDLEGEVIGGNIYAVPSDSVISSALAHFVGEITQTPPAYSAIHVGGKRLYELARAGAVPQDRSIIPERTVRVEAIEVLSVEKPVVKVRISCGGGTYIRSIARDLGERLGCGGTLKSLVREKAGPFELTSAISLEQLEATADVSQQIIDPINALKGLALVHLETPDFERLTKGQTIIIESNDGKIESSLVLTTHLGKAVAVCSHLRLSDERESLKPEVVISDAV